jgi:adenosylcobinamide-phosphate synthase
MSFFAVLFALLIEQVRPLAADNPVHAAARAWVRWVARNFDAGERHHGWLAWVMAAGLPALLAMLVYLALDAALGWPVAILWSTAILYVTLGFRQFSHHFTEIRDALEGGDDARARVLLAQWQQVELADWPREEILRRLIAHSVLAAHRHVFGTLCWFSILAALGLGPAGAVLYRMAELVARPQAVRPQSTAFRAAAQTAWAQVDWLPARVTAVGFAVVGRFEDAIDAWRSRVQRERDADNDAVILAAAAGAIDVNLAPGAGAPTPRAVGVAGDDLDAEDSPEDDTAAQRAPEAGHLRLVVGLVWRSVVLWLLLLALLTLARLLG